MANLDYNDFRRRDCVWRMVLPANSLKLLNGGMAPSYSGHHARAPPGARASTSSDRSTAASAASFNPVPLQTAKVVLGRVLITSRLVQRPGSIRFGPLCGLKSDISRGPRSAISGREQSQQNPLYSITSSASESRLSEILMPSASAVLRLITVSNLVGCSTGRSAGFAPLRIFAV